MASKCAHAAAASEETEDWCRLPHSRGSKGANKPLSDRNIHKTCHHTTMCINVECNTRNNQQEPAKNHIRTCAGYRCLQASKRKRMSHAPAPQEKRRHGRRCASAAHLVARQGEMHGASSASLNSGHDTRSWAKLRVRYPRVR